MKWTNTIEAVKRGARQQWIIGDALKADLGVEKDHRGMVTIPKGTFDEPSKRLKELGFKYDPKTLGRLYVTSIRFSKADRRDDIPWETHHVAATPNNLDRALKELRKLGKSPSGANVRWLMTIWREQASAKREEALADAKAKQQRAKDRKRQAAEKKLAAKDDDARRKASKEYADASEAKEQADAELASVPPEPKFDDNIDPDLMPSITNLELFSFCTALEEDALWMARRIQKNLKRIDKEIDRIPPQVVNRLVQSHTTIITQAQQVIKVLGGVRATLRKVEGGAA